MFERKIRAVITDVDNTLFDWFSIWYHSFSAMIRVLCEESGIPIEIIKRDAQVVHRRHGTSEYAFLIEELECLKIRYKGNIPEEVKNRAIWAFREERRKYLKLYPTVEQTMARLRRDGILIIAYTESMSFYTNYRFRKTGLDQLVDILYSPQDHDLPHGLTAEQIRAYPPDNYKLELTRHEYTPKGLLKPSPEVLESILTSNNLAPFECLYIGDSLMKDIPMAQKLGVCDVWAKYGEVQHKPEYDLLREVTHWPETTVTLERKILAPEGPRVFSPTYTARSNFHEITHLVYGVDEMEAN